jgi:hypothetical protein
MLNDRYRFRVHAFPHLVGGEGVLQPLPGWAAIDVLVRQIDEVQLAKAALQFSARRHRLGQHHTDVCLFAGQDLLAIEVAAVGDGFEFIDLQNGLGFPPYNCKL